MNTTHEIDGKEFAALVKEVFRTPQGERLLSALESIGVSCRLFDSEHDKMIANVGVHDFIAALRDLTDSDADIATDALTDYDI